MNDFADIANLFSDKFKIDPCISTDLIERLQSRQCVDDTEFDQVFPAYYQLQSSIHWSSILVAYQISDWIEPLKTNKFIDIGCGVGKLCLLLGILTNCEVFGIEQRLKLVLVAKKIIKKNSFKKISVAQMNMLDLNWDEYDIYYLYNPFQEHLINGGLSILEKDIVFDQKFYAQYTSEVFNQLSCAKSGKVLITFHGYGGSIPYGWTMTASKHVDDGELTMWIKD